MKRSLKVFLCTVMMLALATSMLACGKKADDNSADVSATVYPLTVTDSNGDQVTIEQEPEKIVSVAPNLTELVFELGASEKLVGRSDYCDYPAEALNVASVGTIMEPNIETIVSLQPDVVLASTHFDEESENKLKEVGINVVVLYEENDVNGVYNMITTVGDILNKSAEAAACVDEMKATIDDVVAKVAGLETPSVYYVVGYGEYGDYTAGGDTFVGGMLTQAGGDNIAKDVSGWSITLEEIIAADPEIIIINEFMKDDFMSQEAYSSLTAVKEGNVYTLDTNLLDRQGYRNAEGILELAKIFHPEAFN